MRIYISGPITGNDRFQDDFKNAARIITEAGHEYINPAALIDVIPGADWEHYMRLDFVLLCEAEAIAFLPGWRFSAGAKAERAWASAFGLYEYDLYSNRFTACDE